MIEDFQREGMEIDEVSRHMHRDQLPEAVPIVDIARHNTFKKQRALVKRLPRTNEGRSRAERPYLADRFLEPLALVVREADPFAIPQEAFGEQGGPTPFLGGAATPP
ncbi:hypothetical protein ACFB49_06280 [Sphingomonas sp. DBB INV C78]